MPVHDWSRVGQAFLHQFHLGRGHEAASLSEITQILPAIGEGERDSIGRL